MFSERPIPKYVRVMMYTFAGVVDLIQFITSFFGIGEIISTPLSIITNWGFFLWLKVYGVTYSKGNTMPVIMLGAVVGFIPVLNALPELSLNIWWMLRENKKMGEQNSIAEKAKKQSEQEEQEMRMAMAKISIQEKAAFTQRRDFDTDISSDDWENNNESGSNLGGRPRTSRAREQDYDPDFESANSSLKNSYSTSKTSDRNPNTLNLRRR